MTAAVTAKVVATAVMFLAGFVSGTLGYLITQHVRWRLKGGKQWEDK